jgi:hypothetical protein
MACELSVISNQNFLFGSTNLNCPDVPIPICPPGNYSIVPVIQNGCIISYNCVLISSAIDNFIPESVDVSGRAGTLFFPDAGLINTTCPIISELSSFIPNILESSGRAGTLFFPDFETKLCVN